MIEESEIVVRLTDVDATYQGRSAIAVRNISLSVVRSEIVGITGATGSGKTTLLRALTQAIPLRRGTREWLAGDATRLAYAPQEDVLLEYRTVWENAALLLESPVTRPGGQNGVRARVEGILSRTGLLDRRDELPTGLSGGMRQRLQVAQALCVQPTLLLLDEPFAQQDRGNQRILETSIYDAARGSGCAVVLVSHDVDALGALCDRTLFLGGSPGRVVREAETPGSLRAIGSDGRRQLPGFPALMEQLWASRAEASLQ